MLFCHFLIMNSLGATTTLCVSQQHSSPKVCLLFHNYRGLSITWRIKRKRPWTFSWTQQNFVYEEKRCPEIMKSCDHFFKLFWQSISIYQKHVLHPFHGVMIYSVTLISTSKQFFLVNLEYLKRDRIILITSIFTFVTGVVRI